MIDVAILVSIILTLFGWLVTELEQLRKRLNKLDERLSRVEGALEIIKQLLDELNNKNSNRK